MTNRRSIAEQESAPAGNPAPLCVDLDGTLVATDMFVETAVSAVANAPMRAFSLLGALTESRAKAKALAAEHAQVDVTILPYREAVIAHLSAERARGRRIILATAADQRIAKQVADHLGIFDEVLASDGNTNLVGARKATALVARFGAKGFGYVGDAPVDLEVWEHASEAVVVGPPALAKRAEKHVPVTTVLPPARPSLKTIAKALRVHQWLKNLLIFLPAFAAHRLREPGMLLHALVAFIAFSLCASAVYVANDLADIGSDRRHRTKRQRPFAAGTLPIAGGVAAVPVLVGAAGLTSLFLPGAFSLVLAGYFAFTSLYTFALKRIALLDVFCLAGLYTVRIFAGAAATAVPVSPWLLAFALFLFLSLALVKRVAELRTAETGGSALAGRGYVPGDLDLLRQMGVASGFMAVLVLALYLQSQTVASLYRRPELLWLVCGLVLFWVSRTWLLTDRGRMHDDPVVFAIKDKVSLAIGLLAALIVVAAT